MAVGIVGLAMKINIPSIGDVLTLKKPWTFTVLDDGYHVSLYYLYSSDSVVLPAGTHIRVSRLSVNKNRSSNVLLTLLDSTTETLFVNVPPEDKQTIECGGQERTISYTVQARRIPATFLVSLADVNTMEIR